jgi:hypothetical protein
MRSKTKAMVAAGLVAVSMAACSTTQSVQSNPGKSTTTASTGATGISSTTSSTEITAARAGSAYLAAVAPVNAVDDTFVAQAHQWTASTTNAQAESDAQPVITALQNLDTVLTNDQWPSNAAADVHTLVGDVGALIGDLQGLSSISLLDASSWQATYQRDASLLTTAVSLVRHDLGLPAASS